MLGSFEPLTGTLNATLTIGYNHDLNPYKHRYHPDHDNLKNGTEAAGLPEILPEGNESYTITRKMTLQFEDSDPEDLRFPGWGDSVAGGSYLETITGLHREPLKVGGTFRIGRVVVE